MCFFPDFMNPASLRTGHDRYKPAHHGGRLAEKRRNRGKVNAGMLEGLAGPGYSSFKSAS